MIRDTTLSAYIELKPELSQRQLQVLDAIKLLGEANNLMISKQIHLPVNCITGRCMELREFGLVEEAVKRKCPFTNRSTWFWRIK